MPDSPDLGLNYRPALPRRLDWRIGCIGSGFIMRVCEDAGIVLAVNQNMRFDQSVRAAKDVLNRGWLGEPVLATIDMRAVPHWMPWTEGLPSLSTFVMSIHHLDKHQSIPTLRTGADLEGVK